MKKTVQTQTNYSKALFVATGEDRFGENRGRGISSIHFKVTTHEANDILIIENNIQESGGPARHLHYNQDEWFSRLKVSLFSW